MASSNAITVASKRDLFRYLRSQDTALPVRTQGRTTQHCERRGVFRLLATLATANRLAYPLTVIHRDKPDFVLQFPGRDVGLEFTEAVSQEEAAIDAQAQHMDKSVWLFEDQFKKGIPMRTATERRQIIENPPLGGPGWGDNRGVPEWVDWILSVIKKKTEDLAKPDFDKYAEDWLLVCDNLPMFSAQTTPKRWTELSVNITHYFAEAWHYGSIFVDSVSELGEFTSAGHSGYVTVRS